MALRNLARALTLDDPSTGGRLDAEVERVESSVLDFAQLRLAHLVLSGIVRFSDGERDEMERMLAVDQPLGTRLALGDDATSAALSVAALEGVGRWRTRGSDPMHDSASAEACETMAHSFEALYAQATTT